MQTVATKFMVFQVRSPPTKENLKKKKRIVTEKFDCQHHIISLTIAVLGTSTIRNPVAFKKVDLPIGKSFPNNRLLIEFLDKPNRQLTRKMKSNI